MRDAEKKQTDDNNKGLIGIFLTLCVVILGLIVAVVFVVIIPSYGNQTVQNTSTTSANDVASRALVVDSEAMVSAYELGMAYEAVNDAAKQALAGGDFDIDVIKGWYDEGIAMARERNDLTYIMVHVKARTDLFVEYGYDREALDALLEEDFSGFSDPDKYRLYTEIIELAKKLGDEYVENEYLIKRTEVEDAYWADYRATEAAVKEIEEKKKRDREIYGE